MSDKPQRDHDRLDPRGIDPRYACFRLGTEQAGNIGLSRYAVELQTERVREALDEPSTRKLGRANAHQRVEVEGHFLLVAVRNGLRIAEHVQKWVGDAKLASALADFSRDFSDAQDFRDVLTHLDDYVRDQGKLQKPRGKGRQTPAVEEGSSSYRYQAGGDVVLGFGPFLVPLLAVGTAAASVLALAGDVWQQGLRDNVDNLDVPGDVWERGWPDPSG